MKCGGKTLVYLSLALSASALGSPADVGRYHGIVERNVFNLKPPPPAVPPEPPAAPPPKITLTGITTILNNKKALLKVAVPAKPPEPAKEESYILTVDESRNDILVIDIDEKAGKVQVNNHGAVQTLDFKNDGAKQIAVAPPPVAPGPGAIPPPTMLPPPPAPQPVQGRTIPTRSMRLPSSGGNPNTVAPPPPAFNNPGASLQPASGLSAEEQEISMALQ